MFLAKAFGSLLNKKGETVDDPPSGETGETGAGVPGKAGPAPDRARYYTKISAYLFYLLSVVVCYEAAVFFWNRMPSGGGALAGLTPDELKAIRDPRARKSVRLGDYFLFGGGPARDAARAANGQPRRSKLDIKITGIAYSSDESRGAAAFISKGTEGTYAAGDKIEGTAAVVERIKPGEIIIRNGGVEEVVKFDEDAYEPPPPEPAKEEGKKKSPAKEELKNVRTELLSNPGNLFNYINIKPAMEKGKIVGYELTPGPEGKLFIDAGLRSGDIAVEINGYDLTDNGQAMAVMGELQNMTRINVVVRRDGGLETVVLETE